MRKIMAVLLLVAAASAAPAHAQSGEDEAVPGGAFRFYAIRDVLDDSYDSFVFVRAADNKNLSLAWTCRQGVLLPLLLHPFVSGDSDDNAHVRYRFDAEPPAKPEYWTVSPTHTVSFPQGHHIAQFTAQARGHRQVIVRLVDPMDSDIETGTFPLAGIGAALARLPCAQ